MGRANGSMSYRVNTSNPFQIPSCLQRADLQQRRRERFKKIFVGAVAGLVVLLVVLLIEGCVDEHSKSSAGTTQRVAAMSDAPPAKVATSELKPVTAAPPKPVAVPSAVVAASHQPKLLYVVEPGDTLSRIARLHQTTVNVLKSVNGLASDVIVVGDKLKLPTS